MRQNLSISIDEDTIIQVRELLKSKTYRNKSHFFEMAANKLIEMKKEVELK